MIIKSFPKCFRMSIWINRTIGERHGVSMFSLSGMSSILLRSCKMEKKQNKVVQQITGIFLPMINCLTAASIIKSVLSLLVSLGALSVPDFLCGLGRFFLLPSVLSGTDGFQTVEDRSVYYVDDSGSHALSGFAFDTGERSESFVVWSYGSTGHLPFRCASGRAGCRIFIFCGKTV